MKNKMNTVLSIAGSDASGGAGIQADIKTMTALGVYGMTAVTALTAQNTTGVYGIMEVTPEFLEKQLDCIFTDIYPDAVKIGMTASEGNIHVIAEKLKQYHAGHIVLDPVMVSTSGSRLATSGAAVRLKEELLAVSEVVTPNIEESQILSGIAINGAADMEKAAETISRNYGCAVLCKGGHGVRDADDFLYQNGEGIWFRGKRIQNSNTHGTGCTLSSAMASYLAQGYILREAVLLAKTYVSGAIGAMLNLGKGSGPMNHAFAIPSIEGEKTDMGKMHEKD